MLSVVLGGMLLTAHAGADPGATRLAAPNWDRELALQTAELGADEAQLRHWFNLARTGQGDALITSVATFTASGDSAAPARERQLYLLLQGLSDFPPEKVPDGLLDLLETYPVRTWVPHDEDFTVAVPLFNIPGAVGGVRNAMAYWRGESRATKLLSASPQRAAAEWVAAYLGGTRPERRGFLAVLDDAAPEELEPIGKLALVRLRTEPDLLAVAGTAALATGKPEALREVLVQGAGPELAPILRGAAGRLDDADQALLLLEVIESAPAENASLAIALLAPHLLPVPAVTESLFDLLPDPVLGAAAGLVLSQHGDPAIQQRLEDLAGGDSPAARRARLFMGDTR